MTATKDRVGARDIGRGVRDLLRGTGSRAESKWMRGLRLAREANLLSGIALRASQRRSEGRTLSDLERQLLDALGTILTDEEITIAGAEYRSAVAELGEVDVLPTAVTSRSLDSAFTTADVLALMPAIRTANAKRANCAIVDVTTLAAGQPVDSPAFDTAMRETAYGITALVGAPLEEGSNPTDIPAYRAKFEFESFTCLKAVGDQWGGKDEIYWTAGARSDKDSRRTFQSEEFGGVKENQTRTFSSSNRVVFDGNAGGFVGMTAMVWEADQSPSAFHKALKEFIEQWLDKPFWMDLTLGIASAFPGGGAAGAIMDMMDVAFQIIHDLKVMFTNDDDLSSQRVFVFDRSAMTTLKNLDGRDFYFDGRQDGMGHHRLRMKYTGDRPIYPAGAMEYAVLTGSGNAWSAPVAMGWDSASSPAVVSHQGRLYCAYVRPGDRALMISSTTTGGHWQVPKRMTANVRTDYAPGLAVFKSQLYAAVTGLGGQLDILRLNANDTWTFLGAVPDSHATAAPALEGRLDRLAVAFRNQNNKAIRKYSSNGESWSGAPMFPPGTKSAVALASRSGLLWFAYLNNDNKINITIDRPDEGDTNLYAPDGWLFPEGCSLTVHNNLVWMAARDMEGRVYAFTSDGTAPKRIGPVTDKVMAGEPAVVSHNGTVYVMYRR